MNVDKQLKEQESVFFAMYNKVQGIGINITGHIKLK